MRPGPWTRGDTLSILKCAPICVALGVLWALFASGGGWFSVAFFFVVGAAEAPVLYLAERYYYMRHPTE